MRYDEVGWLGMVGRSLVLGVACLLVPFNASGTTFVLMDEAELLAASELVMVGTVNTIDSAAPAADGPVYTYVRVEPEQFIKGSAGDGPIVLREPGGTVGERIEWVFGAPEFWKGERSLLFLRRAADGNWETTNLAMGKYTVSIDAAGGLTAVRNFGYGASIFVPETGRLLEAHPQTEPLVPMLERLRRRVRVKAPQGAGAPAAESRAPAAGQPSVAADVPVEWHGAFTLLGSPPGRWFEPDSGQPVGFLVDATGDRTLGPEASRAALDAALAAWTGVPGSRLVLENAGDTEPAPFKGCGVSRVTFNDPFNEIARPNGCGGILAIGGFCANGERGLVNGKKFARIVTGKVMFNDGWGACPFWNACNLAETMTHEIGHAIGLGHSSDRNATMAAIAHFDGRCAGLGSDDAAGVRFIYPESVAFTPVVPTPTRTSTPLPTATPPPAGSTVTPPGSTPTATLTRTPTAIPGLRCAGTQRVQLQWSAKFPSVAKLIFSATHCPPPSFCDTPLVGGLVTAAPVSVAVSDTSNETLEFEVTAPGKHRGGCPSGSDTYQTTAGRVRFVYGANGTTTVLGKLTLQQAVPGPPSLQAPLRFRVRDASGYAIDLAPNTCTTRLSTLRYDIRCY